MVIISLWANKASVYVFIDSVRGPKKDQKARNLGPSSRVVRFVHSRGTKKAKKQKTRKGRKREYARMRAGIAFSLLSLLFRYSSPLWSLKPSSFSEGSTSLRVPKIFPKPLRLRLLPRTDNRNVATLSRPQGT
ncbi:hypothetical protein L596_001513 [Steinernema carpocapsae]|uniref:Uncharacterized protein n=1 Tax=Steinernema carpocapsae TaxID=34508 RepID=A0A4U8UM02_STECR|nr:hypothetical protein L596_001513 [Steinernema carpocapsae]